jgi:hypothetical protein
LVNAANGSSMQGWVYGGCIDFGNKESMKIPTWDKKLTNTEVYIAPCFEGFDEKNNPVCGTDCGIGSISFLNEKEFLSDNYCMGGGTDYCLGTYKVTDNQLFLTFSNKFYNVSDNEEEDETPEDPNAKVENEEKIIIKPKEFTLEFEVHFLGNKPIFLPKQEINEHYLGVPKPWKMNGEVQKIIDELRNET